MESYEQGYEDARFENVVSQNFHCSICPNVLKEPMMCQKNQDCFCRPCITRHLRNSQTCPTCMEELTVETLSEAPRILTDCLSELNIRCDHFERGCREFVQLGDLDTHVKSCGFSPVVCSNEGCRVEINKRDRILHETEVCEFRKVKRHECSKLGKDMDEMKNNLEEMQMNFTAANNEMRTNMSALKNQMKQDMTTLKNEININFEAVNEKLAEMKDITSHLMEIKDKLVSLPNERVHVLQASQVETKKEMAYASKVDRKDCNHCIVIAGGYQSRSRRSVELFDWSNKRWIPLSPMKGEHREASSFVFKDRMIVTGGVFQMTVTPFHFAFLRTNTMEEVMINQVMDSEPWFDFPAKLPNKLSGHGIVVYDGKLIIIGGYDGDEYSDSIHEVLLVPPYTSKLLSRMPQLRKHHGAHLFNDKILICGGRKTGSYRDCFDSVIMYDITKNKCKQMAPLPYAVSEMATVSWGDNVIIMGGHDKDGKALNTVVIYNVKTENSHMLPAMKYKRRGCVAVVVGNTIVVMGGMDERGNCLRCVESFSFESYSWEDLPPMNEIRWLATGVAW